MPCYLTGSALGDAEYSAQEARKEATKLARLLCKTMRRVEAEGLVSQMPDDVQKWWKEHKRIDAEREERERKEREKKALAKKARSKLTPAERRALNLRD